MAPKRKKARPTILEVLTTPRRDPGSPDATGRRKIFGNKAWVHTEELEEWTEFTYENLILAFGPILEQDAPDGLYARDFKSINEKPSNKTHVLNLISQSTMETVKHSADRTAALFPELEHDIIFYFKQGMNIRNPFHPQWNTRAGGKSVRKGGRYGRADWLVYSETADTSSPSPQDRQSGGSIKKTKTKRENTVLLVGECKESSVWTWNRCQEKFRQIYSTPGSSSRARSDQSNLPEPTDAQPELEDDERYALLNPLDQLSTYCFWANVPLRFLHTEKEFILCNTRWIANPDASNKRPRAGVKYVRVPWQSGEAEGVLTPELVLYCIIIAASYSKSYSTSDQYIHEDIITWHRVAGPNDGIPEGKGEGKSKSKRYRNKLLGVVRKEGYLREYKHLKLVD